MSRRCSLLHGSGAPAMHRRCISCQSSICTWVGVPVLLLRSDWNSLLVCARVFLSSLYCRNFGLLRCMLCRWLCQCFWRRLLQAWYRDEVDQARRICPALSIILRPGVCAFISVLCIRIEWIGWRSRYLLHLLLLSRGLRLDGTYLSCTNLLLVRRLLLLHKLSLNIVLCHCSLLLVNGMLNCLWVSLRWRNLFLVRMMLRLRLRVRLGLHPRSLLRLLLLLLRSVLPIMRRVRYGLCRLRAINLLSRILLWSVCRLLLTCIWLWGCRDTGREVSRVWLWECTGERRWSGVFISWVGRSTIVGHNARFGPNLSSWSGVVH